MSSESTLEYLRDRLSSEIRDRLIGISTKAMDLEAFVATCQEIDTNFEIYNKQNRTTVQPKTEPARTGPERMVARSLVAAHVAEMLTSMWKEIVHQLRVIEGREDLHVRHNVRLATEQGHSRARLSRAQ